VAFGVTPETTIDSIDGEVGYRNGLLTARNVTVRGANSDFRLEARRKEAAWQGALTGQQLDLNALEVFRDGLAALRARGQPQGSAPQVARPTTGELTVDVRQLFYRQARFDDVHTEITIKEGEVALRNLSARPYTGAIRGTIHAAAPTEKGRAVTANLDLSGIDVRIIDETAFENARGLRGTLDGILAVSFPLIEDGDPLDHANGRIEFRAANGTFGKLGIATKLLTALRTTEIIQLRLPKLKDEGLAFDTCHGAMVLEDGLMTLQEFEANNPTLLLTARGTVDFQRDQTDLKFDVSILGAITGLMEVVGLEGTARKAQELSSVTLVAVGPPDDPTIRVTKAPAVEQILETVKESEKALREKVKDAAGDAIRTILGE